MKQTQIIRRGIETWEVNQVSGDEPGTHEYELVGRVVRDPETGLYYAEFPKWQEDGHTWERQPRGFLIPKPAFKAIKDHKEMLQ